MQSPPHTRSRTEREDVVEVEPPHSVASQQTVQQSSAAAVSPAPTPPIPVARKRQRAEPAEPRIIRFVVGKFRPSDLKDIKNAKKKLAKPQTQEALQHKEIIYLHRRLKAYRGARKEALGGLLAPRARLDEEDSDEVIEARPALPTPASSRMSADLEGSAELSPLPAPKAPGSGRAAPQAAPSSFPAAPPPGERAGQGPPSPLSPVTEATVRALSQIASEGWDLMTTRCVWWTLTAARDYRTAKENFEQRMQELQWVDNMSRTVTGARTMLANLPQGPSSVADLIGRLRQKQQRGVTVTDDQVERLVGCWLSSAERLSALMGPGRTFLREFLNGVYRTGQALLGATVAAATPAAPVAYPAAPHEPATPVRPLMLDHPPPSPPGGATSPPPLPDPSTEEFRLPESAVATRNPPLQLGMDGLLNGSAGRSPPGDESVPPVGQEPRYTTELSDAEQPAPKRVRTPGR
ncbi:hypothetical protein Emag_007307 [Eimeria magna]